MQAFEDLGKSIDYYALDLSRKELERTLAQVPSFKHVSCHGLWGTYDDGREWLKQASIADRSKCVLHLGSSIGGFFELNRDLYVLKSLGNFSGGEAAGFLKGFADVLQPSDSMIIGVDSCSDPAKV